MRGRPAARAEHGHCPTCVALHGGRDPDFALARLRKLAAGSSRVLRCPNCGREWERTQGGFKRANVAQSELGL